MKNAKKNIMIFGAVVIALLMVPSATSINITQPDKTASGTSIDIAEPDKTTNEIEEVLPDDTDPDALAGFYTVSVSCKMETIKGYWQFIPFCRVTCQDLNTGYVRHRICGFFGMYNFRLPGYHNYRFSFSDPDPRATQTVYNLQGFTSIVLMAGWSTGQIVPAPGPIDNGVMLTN